MKAWARSWARRHEVFSGFALGPQQPLGSRRGNPRFLRVEPAPLGVRRFPRGGVLVPHVPALTNLEFLSKGLVGMTVGALIAAISQSAISRTVDLSC